MTAKPPPLEPPRSESPCIGEWLRVGAYVVAIALCIWLMLRAFGVC